MSCFCQASIAPIAASLPALDLSAAGTLSLAASARAALSLDAWLSARAAIAALNPAWLSLPLPSVDLSPNAVAAIQAVAQLRAQALAGMGADLALPGPAASVAFTRIAVTLNARMTAVTATAAATGVPMAGWGQLASLNAALLRLRAMVQSGALASVDFSAPPSLTLAPVWPPFFTRLAPLAALLTALAQLNLSAPASLAPTLSAIANVRMPALPAANLMAMCRLSAALASVAQLRSALGVDPLQCGFPAIRAMVAANLSATLSALADAGISLSAGLPAVVADAPPVVPGFANAATVRAAARLDVSGLADLAVAADVSDTLRIGLSVSALAANLSTALGVSPSASPCSVCDSRAIMAAF